MWWFPCALKKHYYSSSQNKPLLWCDFNTSAQRYNRGCIEQQRNHWRHRISCCKRVETRPKNKSHVVVIYWLNKSEKNNVTTHISSLNLDSITLSCLLTVSKQLERVSDSLKQFCDSLALSWGPSELLFLTCSRNDLVADRIAKCETFLIAWIFACNELVFARAHRGSSYSQSCFIVCLL